MTILEGAITNKIYPITDNKGDKGCTGIEGSVLNGSDIISNCDRVERGTVCKSTRCDVGNAVGDGQRGQGATPREGVVVDGVNSVSDYQGGKGGAEGESMNLNMGDVVTHSY